MPHCKKCGTVYLKSLGGCPRCSTDALLKQQTDELNAVELVLSDEQKRVKRYRWIGLCVGVPGLIGFIYAMIYIMKLWQGQ